MKYLMTILVMVLGLTNLSYAKELKSTALQMIRDYGITQCDAFVMEQMYPHPNWNLAASAFKKLDGSTKEATIVMTGGANGDTVKTEATFFQTPHQCLVIKRATLTFQKSCRDAADKEWKVASEMSGTDYTQYETPQGVDVFAKDVTVKGGQSICVQEMLMRTSVYH